MATRGKRETSKRRVETNGTSVATAAKERREVAAEPAVSAPGDPPARGKPLAPVRARPSRGERATAESRLQEVDAVCAGWLDIVAERMAADQTFADLVEEARYGARDLRGLFVWDALQAAESHVALIQDVLAKHIVNRQADPLVILEELRVRKRRVGAVYAVNAFLAVLNQMKPEKPKWLALDDLDPRLAVLALAHQTLGYALEALQIAAPPDLTEQILQATQDETVWVWRRMPEPGTDTLAGCAAAAAFFRLLAAPALTTTDEVAALYAEHGASRG